MAKRYCKKKYRDSDWDDSDSDSDSDDLVPMVVGCVAGAPVIGMVARKLVPHVMSAFGDIVPGIGTLHASYAAGGLAASLQVASAHLLSVGAVVVGTVGAVYGLVSRRRWC